MAQQTWVFDAPTGTYKNHALSNDLRMASVEMSVFMDHTRPEPNYGVGRGESITITRVSNVTEPTSADLNETQRISEDEFDLSTKQITVSEIGRAIPFTSLSTDLSEFDLDNPIQSKLREQMTLTVDTKAAVGFRNTQIKFASTSATAGTFQTNGSFSGTATNDATIDHLALIRDYLFDDLHAAPMADGMYTGIFRTRSIRGVKNDSDFLSWLQYTDPSLKFRSEVGSWEQIRLIETNHNLAMREVGANTVGEGVVFGEGAVAMAEAMAPELRVAMPTDFGRSRSVAWYGILEFDQVWDTGNAGEATTVHFGSA